MLLSPNTFRKYQEAELTLTNQNRKVLVQLNEYLIAGCLECDLAGAMHAQGIRIHSQFFIAKSHSPSL